MTAELAVAFAAVGFILTVAVGAISAAVSQLECVDAARAAVRLVARSETPQAAQAAAAQRAPAGAVVTVARSAGSVTVTVSEVVRLVAPLPAFTVSATAVAAVEGLS